MTEPEIKVGRDLDEALATALGLETIDKEGLRFAFLLPGENKDGIGLIEPCVEPSTSIKDAYMLFRHVWNMEDSPLEREWQWPANWLSEMFDALMGDAEGICRLILEVCEGAKA